MHWTTDAWVTALGRTTLMVAVSAAAVAVLIRLLRIRSTAVQRLAWAIVLLQGCLLAQVPIVVEQTAPAATESGSPALSVKSADTSLSSPGAMVPPPHRRDTNAAETPPAEGETAALSTATSPSLAAGSMSAAAPIPWNRVLLAIWLGGVLLVPFVCAYRYVAFLKLLRSTREPGADWSVELDQVRAKLGVTGRIALRIGEDLGPCLVRRLRGSCIVVPQSLWTALGPHQRQAVLRHELAHHVRGDLWKSLAVRLLSAPQWFNPAAWWAVRRFDECAEWASDELAAGEGSSTAEYSRLLLSLGTAHAPRATYLPAARRGSVSTRIRRLITVPRPDSRLVRCAIPLCAAALLAVNLLRIEVVAQTPPEKPATAAAPSTPGSPGHMPWHPDDLVAVLGDDRGKLWSYAGHLMLTPDGRRLIADAGHSSLFIYDADTLDVLTTFGDRPSRLMAAALSQDGSRLIAGYADGSLTLWNITGEQPELEQTVNVMPAEVEQPYLSFAHALRADRVAITVRNRLLLWELQGDWLAEVLSATFESDLYQPAISPNGQQLLTKITIRPDNPIPPDRIIEVDGMKYTRLDCHLVLWKVAGAQLEELSRHTTAEFQNAVFLPDGATIIGSSQFPGPPVVTRCLRIVDGKLVEQPDLPVVLNPFAPPAFSSDGRRMTVMTAREQQSQLQVMDISQKEWRSIGVLDTGSGLESRTVFSPVGDSIFGSAGCAVHRWDRNAEGGYTRVSPEPPHNSRVGEILFDSTGKTLTSAGGHTLCEWDLRRPGAAQPVVHEVNMVPSGGMGLAAWPERNGVFYRSSGARNGIQLWDQTRGELSELWRIDFGDNYRDSAWCFAVQPGGRLLASGHWDRAIRFWNLETDSPRKVAELGAHNGHVCDLAFSPDGKMLASVGWDHAVKLWDMTTDPPSAGRELGKHEEIVRSVAFSPDGRWLASGDEKGIIKLWDLKFNELSGVNIRHPEDIARIASPYDEHRTVNTLEFSADGRRLLSADGGGRVTVWSVPTGEIVKRWTFPGWVWAARWSPDQQLIATANQNGTVYLLVAPEP
jgi:WD40 repeat protein/beta-lactamase regulating signal transducer with metallopeptidase domain